MYPLCPSVILLSVLPLAASSGTPLVIPWNTTHSYGPDGPWSVVTVQVGSSDAADTKPLSTVDLYPGGIWQSMIIRGIFCNGDGTINGDDSKQCLAKQAGLYMVGESKTVLQGITKAVGLVWQWASNQAEDVHGIANNVLDTVRIPTLHGTFVVHNSTISVVQAWEIGLPDGTHYSAQVGSLSLGAPGTGTQSFDANVTGQTVPGYAYAQGLVASNSWGLHYGSASLNQVGSLVFGGYDQSRVLGDVGAFDLAPDSCMLANLVDIQMGVENGSSPFSENTYTGLLKLNASSNGIQPTVINPIVPYLFLSPETCAAIAKQLPVTLNSQLGLYIWNTTDPQYESVVKSSAYLAFVFQKADTGNLTIKVSFQLLNLTLEAPMTTTTQQYFPCRPFSALDNSGRYFLGKAFLQAAFIGMNWQENKFFLAQAPGPGVGVPNIQSIGPNDITISSDPVENFATTWASEWKAPGIVNGTLAVPTTNGHKSTPTTGAGKNLTAIPTVATGGNKGVSRSGFSGGTKASIAMGVGVGALAIAGTIFLFYKRGLRTAVLPQETPVLERQDVCVRERDEAMRSPEIGGVSRVPAIGGSPHYEADNDHKSDGMTPIEIDGGCLYEADNHHQIYELDVKGSK